MIGCTFLHTVNDRISARGAYLKIIFLRGRLFEPGRLNGSGRLLNYLFELKYEEDKNKLRKKPCLDFF